MADASLGLYNALSRYSDLVDLIAEGEAESLHLECKSPGSPKLGKDLKNALAKAISGFSNTAGGVILWGIRLRTHKKDSLSNEFVIQGFRRETNDGSQLFLARREAILAA